MEKMLFAYARRDCLWVKWESIKLWVMQERKYVINDGDTSLWEILRCLSWLYSQVEVYVVVGSSLRASHRFRSFPELQCDQHLLAPQIRTGVRSWFEHKLNCNKALYNPQRFSKGCIQNCFFHHLKLYSEAFHFKVSTTFNGSSNGLRYFDGQKFSVEVKIKTNFFFGYKTHPDYYHRTLIVGKGRLWVTLFIYKYETSTTCPLNETTQRFVLINKWCLWVQSACLKILKQNLVKTFKHFSFKIC